MKHDAKKQSKGSYVEIILLNYLVENKFVEEENESVSFQFVCALQSQRSLDFTIKWWNHLTTMM